MKHIELTFKDNGGHRWHRILPEDIICVFPDHQINISHVHYLEVTDSLIIALTNKPERIDIDSQHNAWLHGKDGIVTFPEPYKSLDDETSEIFWERHKTGVK